MASTATRLTITSAVGFRRPEYTIQAPKPIMTTTFTLNGDTFPDPALGTIKVLTASTPVDFLLYPGGTSDPQEIYLTNSGNADIELTAPYIRQSRNGGLEAELGGPLADADPKIIPAGSTGTFTLAYSGIESGEFSNWIVITSDADNPFLKILTSQTVFDSTYFYVNPGSITDEINDPISYRDYNFEIIPTVNGEPDTTAEISVTGTITGNGWEVINEGINSIGARLKLSSFSTATYNAVLSIAGVGATFNVPLSVDVDIDFETENLHYTSWTSPISSDNSIIAVSIDRVADQNILTIGVGLGGDGTPVYANGGSMWNDIDALGHLGGDILLTPYVGWAEGYRFPLLADGTDRTYLSGATDADGNYLYKRKFTETLNYGDYFGTDESERTMFIVENRGNGDIRIFLNELREYSGNEDFDKTLYNLTRAFDYYSESDVGGRITNLVQYPFNSSTVYTANTSTTPLPPGETRTNQFIGFDLESTATWVVATTYVDFSK